MFAFVKAPSPKVNGRQNLDDIIIEKRFPAPVDGSWWTRYGPVGFTARATALFRVKYPVSTDAEQPKRASEWDEP